MSFWIDGFYTDDLLDYWPEWIHIRNNEGYLAPGEVRRRKKKTTTTKKKKKKKRRGSSRRGGGGWKEL